MIYYVANGGINKLPVFINDSDDDLKSFEEETEGFVTWIFHLREWKGVKIQTPEHNDNWKSAADLLSISYMRMPPSIKERIDKGVSSLEDVKRYLQDMKESE